MTARRAALRLLACAAFACLIGGAGAARAGDALPNAPLPKELVGIGIEDRRGQQVPIGPGDGAPRFVDHSGRAVTLSEYFKAGRPVLLTLNYYACPTLCSIQLNGLLAGLRAVGFTPGREFDIVTVSVDPTEGPKLAAAKRASYLEALGRPVAEGAWPFLTGQEADIRRLADAVGFRYRYDAQSRQFAHTAGVFVLSPTGQISQVLYGIEYSARDLRLALVEAARGGIGSPVDRLLLFCYHYDPDARRYLITPMGVMRIGGTLTVVILGLFLLTLWRRERRNPVVHG